MRPATKNTTETETRGSQYYLRVANDSTAEAEISLPLEFSLL